MSFKVMTEHLQPRVTLKPLSSLVFAHEHITSDDGNIFPPLRRNETDVAMAVFQVALSDAAME